MTEGKSVLRSDGRWLKSRHTVVLLLVLLLVSLCAIVAGIVLVTATSSEDPDTAMALTTAATLSSATTKTGNTNAGRVTLRRYCRFPGHVSGGKTTINCLIDSKDPNSIVHWSLVTKDGHTLDLGQCVGMRDTCQSPLSPNIMLFRWYSWSSVTFSDSQLMSGNTLVCSASHLGSVRSDRCVLHEPRSKARTTTTSTTTTASTPSDQGTGRVSLRRYCRFPSEENGKTTISCLIDSKDPNSTVHWSLVTKDGHTLDLGQCVGMRDTCQSLLSPNITLFRWYSWSRVTVSDSQLMSGNTLVCSASHLGSVRSDRCVLHEPRNKARTTSTSTTTTASTPNDQGTGQVSLRRYCSFPREENGKAKISCRIDSKDPNSTVHWSLVTKDGHTLDFGQCVGMRDTCQSPLSPNITLSRWYSWSSVTMPEAVARSGGTLVCSATHFGQQRSDQCVPYDEEGFEDCTVGESACRAKGWFDTGSINGVAVCCPPGQGLYIDLSNKQHPCLC